MGQTAHENGWTRNGRITSNPTALVARGWNTGIFGASDGVAGLPEECGEMERR